MVLEVVKTGCTIQVVNKNDAVYTVDVGNEMNSF
jgi:hypothetical protein